MMHIVADAALRGYVVFSNSLAGALAPQGGVPRTRCDLARAVMPPVDKFAGEFKGLALALVIPFAIAAASLLVVGAGHRGARMGSLRWLMFLFGGVFILLTVGAIFTIAVGKTC